MSDGFDWGLRPGGGANDPVKPEATESEPQAEPEPVPESASEPEPDPEPPAPQPAPWEAGSTQLLPQSEPNPFATELFPTEAPAPATELLGSNPIPFGDPDSALDALFGETQFREYESGVVDSGASPFAAKAASEEPGSPVESPERGRVSRSQKVLLWMAGGLVAVLALVALFFVGTRLPAIFAHQASVVLSSPSASPTPTSSAASNGPVANGVHSWSELRGGECLDPYTNPWAEKFTVVDCATPHPAQMVFRGAFDTKTDPTFPGADKLQGQISLLCAAPGVINLAAAGAYDDAQIQGSYAVNDEEWSAGQHDYFCFVSRKSGQPLTGSVAVAPAAPATPAP